MDAWKREETSLKAPSRAEDEFRVSAPSLSLPKGGGAIRGIGEKFAANPVTGTGSLSVPIATSPGRGGFGPKLSLSYDSGAGNGPFGFGWSVLLPSIMRKTDKGLPLYRDQEESDVFILSGSEDLVPELDANGAFVESDRDGYRVRRYRPRVEGAFARIERWTSANDVYWRSISRDNVTTVYGRTLESRIADPADPTRIFTWLICETTDGKGNAVVYSYVGEDSEGVNRFAPHERNRPVAFRADVDAAGQPKPKLAGRYLKRIQYGNVVSRLAKPPPAEDTWLFEVVLDYDEGHWQELPLEADKHTRVQVAAEIGADPALIWQARPDPFSSYRAGFEVRTHRRCRRVLVFHRFAELGAEPYLVRSTDLEYADLASVPEPDVETELAHDGSTRVASFLKRVTQYGHVEDAAKPLSEHNGVKFLSYLAKPLPPVEFEYSRAQIDDTPRHVDQESAENLPVGLDGASYQWVDLDGEGLSGVLSEQAGGWYYKRNLSALPATGSDGSPVFSARLSPLESVTPLPSPAARGGSHQFLDLAGNGRVDVVQLDGPVRGRMERTADDDWEPFVPFEQLPNIDFKDPNLRFVDLTGDGHADILVTGDQAFTWYPSLAEHGFAGAERVLTLLDEERGPNLVFADGTQSIYLADMSGDGLSDLVRIRNGEVCYWPNLGYGRFGAKVAMDHAPWFDAPELFDQKRLRVADLDGSGTSDLVYLRADGVDLYFNLSGNGFASARRLAQLPLVDNLSSVTLVDLLGNGTACLVWSSPLPGDAPRPLRYIDLMSGKKPHLLTSVTNHLGARTQIEYTPSTQFYLEDRRAGKPWLTRLPFPVHCVSRVTVQDAWRRTSFSTSYSYHHGYFDGEEREFRGFGRVEQIDVESYGECQEANTASPYVADDLTLYQPPLKTVTWYHTGLFFDRERILSQYREEYFPSWFGAAYPERKDDFQANALPEPELATLDLSAEEWREGLRACKGMVLRQEVYELSVDNLTRADVGPNQRAEPVKLFSTAYHNCRIERVQEQGKNLHAVFLVTESEAVTYQYELDLRPGVAGLDANSGPDPRIAHSFNLETDCFGNVLEAVTVVYPRVRRHTDATLPPGAEARIAQVQQEPHASYTESHFTNDVDDLDAHRVPAPSEVFTYELTGISTKATGALVASSGSTRYFTLADLKNLAPSGTSVLAELAYQELPTAAAPGAAEVPEKRLIERVRTRYFDENLIDPLAQGALNALGLTYETYKLALTEPLLAAIFGGKLTPSVTAELQKPDRSGYLADTSGLYWICSGRAGFVPDAAAQFYLPTLYTDAFGNQTTLAYDAQGYFLYVASSADPKGNTTSVGQFDFRVLAPSELTDVNDNVSTILFDALGLPTAVALSGKGAAGDDNFTGDSLTGLGAALVDPPLDDVIAYFRSAYNPAQSQAFLQGASARHVYYFGQEYVAGVLSWGQHPPCAAGIVRERHVDDLRVEPSDSDPNPIQVAFEHSDGSGSVLVKKALAEADESTPGLRWLASGKTVVNNKGKPVKQYEPYFTESEQRFEEPQEVGVTTLMYYEAAGRLVRTELPDGSYSRVEFSPWDVRTFDANDTVGEAGNAWYAQRTAPGAPAEDQRAAALALVHAGTPAQTFLDSLGRDVISVAHNRYQYPGAPTSADEKTLTVTTLDAEGKPLWIRDARGNLVMQYVQPPMADSARLDATAGFAPCYDIAGNLLFEHSMDAGDRYTLNDAAGKAMFAWDSNERLDDQGNPTSEARAFETKYDELHRPTELSLSINNQPATVVIERFAYGEALANAKQRNLRGQLTDHYDPSGLTKVVSFDLQGAAREIRRQVPTEYAAAVLDWSGDTAGKLETETFVQLTVNDALGRLRRLFNWHVLGASSRVAVYEPKYNERGLLRSEDLVVRGTKTTPTAASPQGYSEGATSERNAVIMAITYDAKGQRQLVQHGNGTRSRFTYDSQTFRLMQLRTTRQGYDPDFPSKPGQFKDAGVLQNLSYTYDAVGNVSEIYDDAYEPEFFANQQVEPKAQYTYDARYRLIAATGREHFSKDTAPGSQDAAALSPLSPQFSTSSPGSAANPNALRNYEQRYTYDSVGNVAEMLHTAGSERWRRKYDYADFSNRLAHTWFGNLALANANPANLITYEHDTHGNVLNLDQVTRPFYLHWDHQDMIQSLNRGGGGIVYYQYDSQKQRTRKVCFNNGVKVWERRYLGGLELYRVYAADGTVLEETESLHVFEGQHRVLLVEDLLITKPAVAPGSLYRYQHGNHLGSACLELDDGANVITYEEYHPYGTSAYRTARSQTEAPKRYRYTGMERDEESGLSYHTARYYLPWLGRWGSADPGGLVDGPNLYAAAGNQPTTNSDRTGFVGEKVQQPDSDQSGFPAVASPSGPTVLGPDTAGGGFIEIPAPNAVQVGCRSCHFDDAATAEPTAQKPNQLTVGEFMKLSPREQREAAGPMADLMTVTYNPELPGPLGIVVTRRLTLDAVEDQENMAANFAILTAFLTALGSNYPSGTTATGLSPKLPAASVESDVLRQGRKTGDPIPPTGVPHLDARGDSSPLFPGFKAQVERMGFKVLPRTMSPAERAFLEPSSRKFVYDPKRFTVLDMLHETLHLDQFEKAGHFRITGVRPEREMKAYAFERFLLQQAKKEGFTVTPEYQTFLRENYHHYRLQLR